MRYKIRYSDEAKRALRGLPGHYRQRIKRLIEALARDPRPNYAEDLRDRPMRFKIPVDKWRLIYEVEDASGTVWILRVKIKTGPETYAGLDDLILRRF